MTWKEYLDEMKVEFLLKASVIPRRAFKRTNLYKERNWNLVAGEQ